MAMVYSSLNPNDKPALDMLAELERASKMPITYDDDCPGVTDFQMERLKKFAESRKRPA